MAHGVDHRDKNGVEIHKGDVVRWGDREGEALIIEPPLTGTGAAREGIGTVYVSKVGTWGDCRCLRANQLEVVGR